MIKSILLIMFLVAGSFVYATGDKELEKPGGVPLISLYNDKEKEGSFFLASGWIGEVEYLFAFVQRELGIVRLQVAIGNCYIIEDEDVNPYVWRDSRYFNLYYFHVPAGTIIRRMELR